MGAMLFPHLSKSAISKIIIRLIKRLRNTEQAELENAGADQIEEQDDSPAGSASAPPAVNSSIKVRPGTSCMNIEETHDNDNMPLPRMQLLKNLSLKEKLQHAIDANSKETGVAKKVRSIEAAIKKELIFFEDEGVKGTNLQLVYDYLQYHQRVLKPKEYFLPPVDFVANLEVDWATKLLILYVCFGRISKNCKCMLSFDFVQLKGL